MRPHFAAVLGSAALALGLLSFGAAHAQDAAAGQAIFKVKCNVCHSLVSGHFSDALKNSGKTWNAATLEAYLADPRGYIPGVKMTIKGLTEAADRANMVAFLSTLKK
jgi:cytochrome c